jgi:aspartokinase/homoserine dehydrogenase 1
MKVMKFGGSSVRDAGHIKKVVDIFTRDGAVRAVICSAMKGVTNDLIAAANMAEAGDREYSALLDGIWARHAEAADALLDAPETLLSDLQRDFDELEEICHGVFLVKECSPRSMDLIMSFGERLNNQLIAEYAARLGHEVRYVDARPLVLTDGSHGNGEVRFEESYRRIREYFSGMPGIAVVTGFIASTTEGITTTLGRNGSDYSASIFGAALGADDIEIWTDVDGVLEADPRVVPGAGVIEELSIDEAMEMSYFGAEVLHPSTMIPAVETAIPVWIKNTMNPEARGTRIAANARANPNTITGIASITGVSLVNVIGGGMVGAKGTAMKIFAALARADVNAIMISQASSEHSVCVVIRSAEVDRALTNLQSELAHELRARSIQNIDVVSGLEVMAIIGGNMRGRPGVAGRLFSSLGNEEVNILAIAQGSSEMNLSFVIREADHEQALKTVHRAFFTAGGGKGGAA